MVLTTTNALTPFFCLKSVLLHYSLWNKKSKCTIWKSHQKSIPYPLPLYTGVIFTFPSKIYQNVNFLLTHSCEFKNIFQFWYPWGCCEASHWEKMTFDQQFSLSSISGSTCPNNVIFGRVVQHFERTYTPNFSHFWKGVLNGLYDFTWNDPLAIVGLFNFKFFQS